MRLKFSLWTSMLRSISLLDRPPLQIPLLTSFEMLPFLSMAWESETLSLCEGDFANSSAVKVFLNRELTPE